MDLIIVQVSVMTMIYFFFYAANFVPFFAVYTIQ